MKIRVKLPELTTTSWSEVARITTDVSKVLATEDPNVKPRILTTVFDQQVELKLLEIILGKRRADFWFENS